MTTAPRLETCHGGKYWSARWTDHTGRVRCKGLGSTAKVSEKAARRKLAELAGNIPKYVEDGKLTVREWCERRIDERNGIADGTRDLLKATADKLATHFGEAKASDIDPADAARWVTWLETETFRGGKLSPFTVRSHLTNARALFKRFDPNPFKDAEPPKCEVKDDWRFVTLAELDAILGACPNPAWETLFSLCRLAGTRVGLRGGEALGAQWPDVNWRDKSVRIWDQKRSRERIVPVCPRLYSDLEHGFRHTSDKNGPICPVMVSDVPRKGRSIIEAAGLEPWDKPFHSLRKSCETEWLDNPNLPLPAVCEWLGNSIAVAVAHYRKRVNTGAMATITG